MTADMNTELDFSITNEGNVVSFRIHTEAARDWVDSNLDDLQSWQWLGKDVFILDHRLAGDIANALAEHGFNVG